MMSKKEKRAWRETCDILSDEETKKSILISLQQFSEGKGIPLSQL